MNYKEVIESRYNRQNWQLLLHDIFGSKVKFWNTPSVIPTSSQFAKQALWLGTITLSDEQTIAIYEVELSDSVDIERNRRGIRDMLLTSWRNNGNAGAFMFCYRKNESVLRFSYVSESWNFADDGTYKKESTDTKRFTYLLGEGHRSRTAIQQFEKLRDSQLSLKDLTKAFSVEAVSDMFFNGYKKQYEDIIFYVTGKRMVKVANKWEERQEGQPCQYIMQQFSNFPNPEKSIRDYVKKLMGRLVFLQFLQKKGWLGVPVNAEWGEGDPEFILNLYESCNDKDHFIDNVLEALFNDLNSERTNDLVSSAVGLQIRVPYLNGGLFEREATDETEFPLPAEYMQSLLDFFASYNFTIDENDPDDAEVGVDPEMLGRIFENLLEDNKDKGAFYTPKEIVSYMCRESLIAYLQTGIEDEPTKEAIRQFVTTHDVAALGTNDKFRQQVDEALCNVKICDPAIGSGAFPMGLLKELFQCRTALEGITQSKAAEIKKHIIQQNIYGVDIERGAVDIARLRFWLSLIVDEETPQALPNLDFKIIQGNSLLEQYKGVDLSTMTEKKADESGMLSIFDSMLDVYRLDLRKMLAKYYDCTDHHEKQSLRKEIVENVKQQLREQSINVDFGDLDLSGNTQFMLWHTWFYDVFSQGGFDIVIGNPPYGAKLSNNEKKLYRDLYPETQFKIDTYSLFTLLSLNILSEGGFCYYIIPNTLLDNYFEEEVRRKLLLNRVYEINDLSDKVFETAVVHSMIFAFCKEQSSEYNIRVSTSENLGKINVLIPSSYFEGQPQCTYSIRTYGSSDLMDKLRIQSIRLADVIDIRQAIKSGNDALYISEYRMNDNYQPILRGKDIKKYTIYNPHLYLNYGRHLACPRSKEIFEQPKILIREAGAEITATYDDSNFYIMSSLYNAILINKEFSLKYILGLLNSKLYQYLMYKLTFEKTKGAFTKAKIYHYYELPVRKCADSEQEAIINKVNAILSVKYSNPTADTSALEFDIDQLVYQLYDLTEEEIKIVEQSK